MLIVLFLLSGLTLLYFGGKYLVSSSTMLALQLNVSPLVIGATIVACGTSMPELTVSLDSILSNHPDIVIGNIIGSNIVNILIVISTTSLFKAITVSRIDIIRQGNVMILFTLVFFWLCTGGEITRWHGVLLLTLLTIYVLKSIFYDHNTSEEVVAPANIVHGKAVLFLQIVISLAALAFGASLFVDGSLMLGKILGVSEAILGLTIVAVGTAAPEIAISIIAAIEKRSDLAVGNIIGSNIFNILGIGGVTSLVLPIEVNKQFLQVDCWFLLAASVFMVAYGFIFQKMDRWFGILGLAFYAGYGYVLLS